MSSPPTPPPPTALAPEIRDFMRVWIDGMTQVLTQIAGSRFSVEEKPPGDAAAEGDFHILIAASASLRGEMAFRMPRLSALAVAQLFLGETQDPAAEFTGESREALEELLRQISGHVATALKGRYGEVQMRLEFGNPPSWPPGVSGWAGSATGAPCAFTLEWQMSAALIAALRASAPAETAAAPPAEASAAPPPADSPGAPSGKLDIFMDVPLGVTLRFGGRRMLLKEILELSAGAVVELDREVHEAVDLLLDGKLIARGEVVVVDGNYGLRITQVSPTFVATQ